MVTIAAAQRYEMIGLGVTILGMLLAMAGCAAGLGVASGALMIPGLGIFLYGRMLR